MEHKYKSRVIDGFVTNLKSTIFDVMTSMRRNMDIIEAQIGSAKDEQKEMELQRLWAEYHEADKQCLVAAKRMESAMEKLDTCFQAYYTSLYQPNTLKKPNENNNQQEVVENINTVSQPQTEKTTDEVKENALSEPLQEAAVTTPQEANVLPEPLQEAAVTTPQEANVLPEPLQEAAVTTPQETNVLPKPLQETAVTTPQEANVLPEPLQETAVTTPQETNVLPEPLQETAVATPEANILPEPLQETTVDKPAEEEPIQETTVEEPNQTIESKPVENNGILPLIPEDSQLQANPVQESVPESTDLKSLLPVSDETNKQENITVDNNKPVFKKEGNAPVKAIIVSAEQKSNCLKHLNDNPNILENSSNNSNTVDSKNESLEEMMSQLTQSYAEGNVEKAEELSEKIRVLTKNTEN